MATRAAGQGWVIESDGASWVEGRSAFALPFQPKAAKLAYKLALREALCHLPPAREAILQATYVGPLSVMNADAENILFYNVGASAFSSLARRGIQFRRTIAAEAPADALPHRVCYKIVPLPQPLPPLPGAIALTPVSFDLHSAVKTALVWAATRKTFPAGAADDALIHQGPFMLRIVIAAPAKPAVNLAGKLKPILDGIVSALHAATGPLDRTLLRRVAVQTGVPEATVAVWLTAKGPFVLSHKSPVYPYGSGVQWSPDDHHLHWADVYVGDAASDSPGTMAITIAPIAPESA